MSDETVEFAKAFIDQCREVDARTLEKMLTHADDVLMLCKALVEKSAPSEANHVDCERLNWLEKNASSTECGGRIEIRFRFSDSERPAPEPSTFRDLIDAARKYVGQASNTPEKGL